MRRMVGRASLLIVSVLVLATGCGGSGKKQSAPPATTTAAAPKATTAPRKHPATTTTAPAPAATPQPGTKADAAFATPGHCSVLRSLGAKISQAVPPTLNVSRSNIAAETAALEAVANSAPAEIRSDFQRYVAAFSGYMRTYASIGIRPGKPLTHAQYLRITKAATAVINTPGLAAAEQNIKHWTRAHCPKVPKKR